MVIDYIYIEGYEQIISSINLNFGGPIKYNFENNRIKSYKNEYFIRNFYMEKNCIKQISAIIGKNSSGKTTILRIINMIFSHLPINFKYVLIYRTNKGKYYTTNIKDVKIDHKEMQKGDRDYIGSVKIIYFSSIFDKSNRMLDNYNLEDISSNTLLRDYVNTYYKSKIYNLGTGDKSFKLLEKIKRKDIDLIDEFRKSESMLRLKYFNKIGKLEKTSKFKSLFKSPVYINISYADDSIYKLDRLSKIGDYVKESKLDRDILTNLTEINNIIDEIIFSSNKYLNEIELKRKYKNEYLGMLIFEVFSNLLLEYDFDIASYTYMFLDLLYEKEYYEYDIEPIFFKIAEIIKYDYAHIKIDYNEYEHSIKNVQYEQNDSIANLQYLYNSNNKVIDLIEDMDLINCKYIAEGILERIEIIFNEDIDNINNLLNIDVEESEIEQKNSLCVIENIIKDEDIDSFNVINYIEHKGKNIESIVNNLRLIYMNILDNIEEDYYDGILEEQISNINYVNAQLVYIIEKLEMPYSNIIEDKKVENIPEFVINQMRDDLVFDLDSDVLTFILDIEDLASSKMKLINNNYVKADQHDILNLKAKWANEDVIEYISSFNNHNFESLNLIYDHEELSSGQNAYLDMMSRMLNLGEKLKWNRDIILMIDEGDVNLHPEVQVDFVNNLILFLVEFFKEKNIQVILTTNSPFIVSDIPHSNLIYLERNKEIKVKLKEIADVKTFGVNINELLINSFYMTKGIIGTFAQSRIDYIIEYLINGKQNKEKSIFIRKNIELIGDYLLHTKLKEMYINKYGMDEQEVYREINYYKKILSELEGKLKDD
ncbi:MAG: hypothetical protein ABF652_05390 [Clostridium beijerinckii]